MKTNPLTAVSAVVLSVGTLVSGPAFAATTPPNTIPSIPVGVMSAFPTIVQTGTRPTLTWNILYPSKVTDLVEINPPGTLIPQDTVYTNVQIVGTDIKPCNVCSTVVAHARPGELRMRIDDAYQQMLIGTHPNRGPIKVRILADLCQNVRRIYTDIMDFNTFPTLDSTGHYAKNGGLKPFYPSGIFNQQETIPVATTPTTYTPVPTEARVSVNGGLYEQLFYGTQADVDPAHNLFIKKLFKGQMLDFGGRYVKPDGTWSNFYTTRSSNLQVVALKNGDIPPTSFSLYRQGFLASYLKPYLDASGRVSIGPLSVLIVMELDNSDHANGCFDYQDEILLVTFGTKHPNNGHGNNLDGVDSSNPGQGHGGPNGQIDPSGGFDDERK